VRFLHLLPHSADPKSAQGATEREIGLAELRLSALMRSAARHHVDFPADSSHQALSTILEAEAELLQADVYRLRVSIFNATPSTVSERSQALLQSMISTHTILGMGGGEFLSLLDPPENLREASAECRNIGSWPVLAGEEASHDAMLSSPIILYDYPQIAAESPGALFDGTEIDEILTLRIMTLTDEEKAEMALADERTREILARTESLPPEQFLKLHGALRTLPSRSPSESQETQ
jgi:hypothetical protein